MTNLLLALAVVSLMAAAPQNPATPFPHHEQPPRGWFCVPSDTQHRVETDAHACACLGMISDPICPKPGDKEPPGDLDYPRAPNDNPKCKVYCHKDSCTCMKQCQDT